MHISNVCASGRNCISLSLHARIDFVSLACVRVCVASPNQQGSLSDGGEGEEEQEASRAVRSRHCRNIWQRLTLTHKHTHTLHRACRHTHTHWPVFVLLFLRERKRKWHQAHHVRPMRQMREGVRTLADTEPCYIKLGTGLLWAPLPNYVCVSLSIWTCVCSHAAVCVIWAFAHYFIKVWAYKKWSLLTWLQRNRALCQGATSQLLKVCNTFQSKEMMS